MEPKKPTYATVWNKWPYDLEGFQSTPEYQKFLDDHKEWRKRSPKPEYDHIIPFSEGGPTTLENMRTLCHQCHAKVTTEWRKAKRDNLRTIEAPTKQPNSQPTK